MARFDTLVVEPLGDSIYRTRLTGRGRRRRIEALPPAPQQRDQSLADSLGIAAGGLAQTDVLVLLPDTRCGTGSFRPEPGPVDALDQVEAAASRIVVTGSHDEVLSAGAPNEDGSRIVWSAAPRSHLEELAAQCTELGARSIRAVPIEHALAALCDEAAAVFDLRRETARLCVGKARSLAGSRRFKLPQLGLTTAADALPGFDPLSAVTRELERSLQFLGNQGTPAPGRLLLCAPPEPLLEGADRMAEELGLSVEVLQEQAAQGNPSNDPLAATARVHAALADLDADRVPWLLRPEPASLGQKTQSALRAAGLVLATAGALGLAADFSWDHPALRGREAELLEERQALRDELSDGLDALAIPPAVALRVETRHTLSDPAHALSRLLRDLGGALRAPLALTELHLERDGTLRLAGLCRGDAPSEERIEASARLARALESTPGLSALRGGLQRDEETLESNDHVLTWNGLLDRRWP